MRVLFVCTGNVCRSAMAEAYLKKRIVDEKLENKLKVDSCGIRANTNELSTDKANTVMKKYGVILDGHTAKHIQDIDIDSFDLILTMSTSHKNDVINLYGKKVESKTKLLKEYMYETKEDKYMDIDDPWGLDISVYEYCAKEIVDSIEKFIVSIR